MLPTLQVGGEGWGDMAGQVELPLTHVMGVCVKTPAVSKTIGCIYISLTIVQRWFKTGLAA